jgi:hypothetical protein
MELIRLVEEYSDPKIGGALGLQGEALVLEGFARKQFIMRDRNVRAYGGRRWVETDHDLDFIFERDREVYGVEVKNGLGYMDYEELRTKLRMCGELGIRAVFAVRMLPKVWTNEIIEAGGFSLIFKYQLYPWGYRELARRVARELKLPVDSPKALEDGTVDRFVKWHERRLGISK